MGFIKENEQLSLEQIRGIIICRRANAKLKYAVSILPNVEIREIMDEAKLKAQAEAYLINHT